MQEIKTKPEIEKRVYIETKPKVETRQRLSQR